ncbi:MAG: hypothetical protein IPI52_00205 [Bacteroidetes bacterium]|nr:hypothetical protein [Bacteroidota bacterium]
MASLSIFDILATIFEYNLHRLITVLTNSDALNSDKHNWVKGKLNWFYLLVFLSVLGFAISVIEAKLKVLLTLAPIAGLTLLYSTPLSKTQSAFQTKANSLSENILDFFCMGYRYHSTSSNSFRKSV